MDLKINDLTGRQFFRILDIIFIYMGPNVAMTDHVTIGNLFLLFIYG